MGSLPAAIFQSKATTNAANTAADAQRDALRSNETLTREGIASQKEQSEKALAYLERQSAQSRTDLEPFRNAQLGALSQLDALSQQGNPFEAQQRQVATQQIQQQLAAQGLLRSKSQVDLLSNLELGINEQNYNRRTNLLSMLAGTGGAQQNSSQAIGVGQTGAGVYTGLGAQLGSSFGNLAAQQMAGIGNVGQIIGNGQMQSANQLAAGVTGTISNLGSMFMGYQQNKAAKQNNDRQYELMSKALNREKY